MKSRLLSKYFWIAIALIVYGIIGLVSGGEFSSVELVEKANSFADILGGIAMMILRQTAPQQTPLKPILDK